MPRRGWLFLLLLAGCGGGLERASFATDLLGYPVGARVEVSLVNTGATALGTNLCLSQLISADGKTPGPRSVESCELDVQVLQPGERLTFRKQLPTFLTGGSWRYETTIRLPNGLGEQVLTLPFTVSAN